jgi:Domain of unknown function (DUF4349)
MRLAAHCILIPSCLLIAACVSTPSSRTVSAAPPPARDAAVASLGVPVGSQAAQRLLIRHVALTLEADNPSVLAGQITQVTTEAGGFIEDASTTAGERLEMQLRVPVAQLATVLARLERMGKVKDRRDSARDVTEETIDMEARLGSLVALRDRLRTVLQAAANVQDIMAVERELARVQGEIDSMQARLNYLRSHVALAQVSIRVDQRRVLGPLGWAVAGAAWVLSRLFIIQ